MGRVRDGTSINQLSTTHSFWSKYASTEAQMIWYHHPWKCLPFTQLYSWFVFTVMDYSGNGLFCDRFYQSTFLRGHNKHCSQMLFPRPICLGLLCHFQVFYESLITLPLCLQKNNSLPPTHTICWVTSKLEYRTTLLHFWHLMVCFWHDLLNDKWLQIILKILSITSLKGHK